MSAKNGYKAIKDTKLSDTIVSKTNSVNMAPHASFLALLFAFLMSLAFVEAWKIDQSCQKAGISKWRIPHSRKSLTIQIM